ncbi:phosphosulfolactate synthase [Heliophilum fasciatum]|uniref:Phosphosulfolactate synthase n=1 Tax=Heliophilum fasciatum TaxID=35700 RepID=A0A4R2RXN2_9FIRM|nr:phosphosulfolactate synthase [Heliophilum fasciatum]TCP63875.1 phosphosulfolactate synthase [Heliophilum fasciatum]
MVDYVGWPPVACWPLGHRLIKPRTQGMTMVFDKGIGLSAFRDLLEMAGAFIDWIKLGFASAALYPSWVVQQKVWVARMYGVEVYAGGTLGELAISQGKMDELMTALWQRDIRWLEISDGTIELAVSDRRRWIVKARERGFQVITEVGKKNPAKAPPIQVLVAQANADLTAGASYVIVEGRESGKGVNLFDQHGRLRMDDLEVMVSGITDPAKLIWEAPLKPQQCLLIERMGPNVNFGNIQPEEVFPLEALRCGLRSDTFAMALQRK